MKAPDKGRGAAGLRQLPVGGTGLPSPLLMQSYEGLGFTAVLLPDANKDKPGTADGQVISFPALEPCFLH